MERKIEIYNFAARTRQLFIRLIALVKWANSVSKVDKSAVSVGVVTEKWLPQVPNDIANCLLYFLAEHHELLG